MNHFLWSYLFKGDFFDEIKAFIYKKKHIEPKQEPEKELEGQVTFEDI